MKTFTRPLQSDSFSTQERQKRFNRKSIHNESKSRSSHSKSDSKSISKFFIRNLQATTKPQRIQEIISKNVKSNTNWSPPRRQATPSKTQVQRKLTYTKQQLLDVQTKQNENLKNQIEKYRVYIARQAEILAAAVQENKKLKQEIQSLNRIINQETITNKNLKQKIMQVNENLNHKQMMFQILQRDQSSIVKVKTSIFQARMVEFEKEKQQLNIKIQELEKIVDQLKSNSIMNSVSSVRDLSINNGNILDRSLFSQDDQIQKLQKQLYKAYNQIKRLQISEGCIKRKCYKQIENYKAKKDKQYQDLKKKFSEFLGKYKTTMKKFASFQVKSMLQKNQQKIKQRSNSLQSHISLTLSEDQQHQQNK